MTTPAEQVVQWIAHALRPYRRIHYTAPALPSQWPLFQPPPRVAAPVTVLALLIPPAPIETGAAIKLIDAGHPPG